jgi:hypothetical protein
MSKVDGEKGLSSASRRFILIRQLEASSTSGATTVETRHVARSLRKVE